MQGFDKDYFVQQVAGLAQLAGEFMLAEPRVIDLGWGALKSALGKLPDSAFANSKGAAARRQALIGQYTAAFRQAERGGLQQARGDLASLAANLSAWVASGQQSAIRELVESQLAKLS